MQFFSPAPRPRDEEERQQAVEASGVFLADDHPALREIVEEMAKLFDAQAAAISIVDDHRQYFVAVTGLPIKETSRAVSFCAHAILNPRQILYVEDAEKDSRFAGNPLVTGDSGIRFYVGAPLVAEDGHALGALCAMDGKPHESLSAQQREHLAALARRVMENISQLAR